MRMSLAFLATGIYPRALSAMTYAPLMWAIPGVPLLIVVLARIRSACPFTKRDRQRQAQIAAEGAPKQSDPLKVGFHQAEFVAMKGEIADMLKSMSANFQYAILASAGVLSWLVSADHVAGHIPVVRMNDDLVQYAVWLPFIVSSFFYALSMAIYVRLTDMREYLRRLEKALGAEGLGWEDAFSKRPATLTLIWGCAWIALTVGNYELAVHLLDTPFDSGLNEAVGKVPGAELPLPYWIQLLQALAVPAIALLAVVIGFFQWRTAHKRAVLDLFDGRMKVYTDCRNVLHKITAAPSATTNQHAMEFISISADAEFLFGDEVVRHLKKVTDAILDLATSEAELKNTPVGSERKALVNTSRTSVETITGFYNKEFRSLLRPYMRLKHGLWW